MTTTVVVGGGIVGTMHAFIAHRAGLDVVQLERDPAPRSASVRNFGLVWVSGRADGAELTVALRARELWEDIGGQIPGIGFRAEGSLTVALTEDEWQVMGDFAATPAAAERHIELLSPAEVRARNPALAGRTYGALWCGRDAIVEPGRVLGAIQGWLASQGRYRFCGGRNVVDVRPDAVLDQTGERHHADLVLLCTGDAHDDLVAEHLTGAPLRRVRLQMMQTAPLDLRLLTSVADADSLRYYPAYRQAPLERLGPQDEVAAAHHMQLLMVQRASGGLTVGDTHSYDEPFDFAVDEAPYDYLKARAERILGCPLPPVERRWAGVYSQRTDDGVCFRSEVRPGVWLMTGLGGRGMTCSPAVAEDTLRAAGVLGAPL